MAQLALSAHNQAEVTTSIARGMEILGPSISLDTLVTALVIRVGTLSGVHRLESLCSFAVMSVIVNYVVFMTFYPACLSLILELTRHGVDVARSVKARGKDSLLMRALYDEDQKPNPVVQRVKIIMSTGLIIVHAHRYTEFDLVADTHSGQLEDCPQQSRTVILIIWPSFLPSYFAVAIHSRIRILCRRCHCPTRHTALH